MLRRKNKIKIPIRTYIQRLINHLDMILFHNRFQHNLNHQHLLKCLFKQLLLPAKNLFRHSQAHRRTYYHNHQVGHLTVVSYFDHFCSGKFEHDLFDCCGDIGSCCFSWCCPCIVASQIATKIGHSECCYCLGVWCFGGCAVACLRGDFRKFRKINGGCIADCITSIWCTPCALTQMHKETQNM